MIGRANYRGMVENATPSSDPNYSCNVLPFLLSRSNIVHHPRSSTRNEHKYQRYSPKLHFLTDKWTNWPLRVIDQSDTFCTIFLLVDLNWHSGLDTFKCSLTFLSVQWVPNFPWHSTFCQYQTSRATGTWGSRKVSPTCPMFYSYYVWVEMDSIS